MPKVDRLKNGYFLHIPPSKTPLCAVKWLFLHIDSEVCSKNVGFLRMYDSKV